MDGGLINRDFASLVLDSLDYEAQLAAIRDLLRQHREADVALSNEIESIDRDARRLCGLANERAVDEWLEHMQASVFQDAAHSMAAVGMLAPLIESIFKSAFLGIHKLFAEQQNALIHNVRPEMATNKRWDCQFTRNGGKNLVGGILELIGDLGLAADLPSDLKQTLEALFGYRNKMFHLGFEWPKEERLKFAQRIMNDGWPSHWFKRATTNDEPWIFYMSDLFVEHCLTTTDRILDGLGCFVRRNPIV